MEKGKDFSVFFWLQNLHNSMAPTVFAPNVEDEHGGDEHQGHDQHGHGSAEQKRKNVRKIIKNFLSKFKGFYEMQENRGCKF